MYATMSFTKTSQTIEAAKTFIKEKTISLLGGTVDVEAGRINFPPNSLNMSAIADLKELLGKPEYRFIKCGANQSAGGTSAVLAFRALSFFFRLFHRKATQRHDGQETLSFQTKVFAALTLDLLFFFSFLFSSNPFF